MSLLPNDLASGSTAVIPMLTEAGPTQPFFAPASGGGGGGGGGASISSSGAYVLCSTNGVLVMGNFPGADQPDIQIGDANNTLGISLTNGTADNITLFNGSVKFTTQNVNMAGINLDVSSINGQAPGGGVPTNLEVSTLRVSQGAPNTGIRMKYSDGTSSFGIVANDGTVFNQIKPSLVYGNNFGTVVSLGADIVAGGLGLTGTGGSLTSQTAGYISGDGAGNIGISSLNVSSINSASPGSLAVGGIAKFSTIQVSSIGLQGFSVPLFQNGRLTMPNAPSTVIETDIVFSDTTWGAWAGYDGAVNAAVSSIGTEVLSRSTFALFAQGGLGVSWQVLGN